MSPYKLISLFAISLAVAVLAAVISHVEFMCRKHEGGAEVYFSAVPRH